MKNILIILVTLVYSVASFAELASFQGYINEYESNSEENRRGLRSMIIKFISDSDFLIYSNGLKQKVTYPDALNKDTFIKITNKKSGRDRMAAQLMDFMNQIDPFVNALQDVKKFKGHEDEINYLTESISNTHTRAKVRDGLLKTFNERKYSEPFVAETGKREINTFRYINFFPEERLKELWKELAIEGKREKYHAIKKFLSTGEEDFDNLKGSASINFRQNQIKVYKQLRALVYNELRELIRATEFLADSTQRYKARLEEIHNGKLYAEPLNLLSNYLHHVEVDSKVRGTTYKDVKKNTSIVFYFESELNKLPDHFLPTLMKIDANLIEMILANNSLIKIQLHQDKWNDFEDGDVSNSYYDIHKATLHLQESEFNVFTRVFHKHPNSSIPEISPEKGPQIIGFEFLDESSVNRLILKSAGIEEFALGQ